jgi:hypothetical protein
MSVHRQQVLNDVRDDKAFQPSPARKLVTMVRSDVDQKTGLFEFGFRKKKRGEKI